MMQSVAFSYNTPMPPKSPAIGEAPAAATQNHIRILVVEDDPRLGRAFATYLESFGHTVTLVSHGHEALEAAARQAPHLVFLDLGLPDMPGLELLERLNRSGAIRVAILTGSNEAAMATQALKLGAADYFVKPIEFERLKRFVSTEAERVRMFEELQYHRSKGTAATIVGEHPKVVALRDEIGHVADIKGINILILGPTGAGKELVARSAAKIIGGPFVATNCAAIAESVFEAELFGYEKGAFTGASSAHKGLFALAHGGTLFLDEVSEIPLPMQAKLLRAIETRRYRPIGAEKEESFSCTIVASSNHLREDLAAGKYMRQDLYYRLAGYVLSVPALCERLSDVPLLAQHVLDEFGARLGRPLPPLSDQAARVLMQHSWPGNVRELRNVVETAAIRSYGSGRELADCLAESAFPPAAESARPGAAAPLATAAAPQVPMPISSGELPSLDTVIRRHIEQAMALHANNISAAARALGISRATLRSRLQDQTAVQA